MIYTLLNTSSLTTYGAFQYAPISLEEARALVHNQEFESAIGHESTAQIISELLGIDCPVNRVQYQQQVGMIAIVFKLKGRLEEGKILSKDEIEKIGYEFGLLKRVLVEPVVDTTAQDALEMLQVAVDTLQWVEPGNQIVNEIHKRLAGWLSERVGEQDEKMFTRQL